MFTRFATKANTAKRQNFLEDDWMIELHKHPVFLGIGLIALSLRIIKLNNKRWSNVSQLPYGKAFLQKLDDCVFTCRLFVECSLNGKRRKSCGVTCSTVIMLRGI